MLEDTCQSDGLPSCAPVIPLPVALYVSDGLIFELYNGGQPHRKFVIHWERLSTTVATQEKYEHGCPAIYQVQRENLKGSHSVYERV
jgi:hypothetical protein